MANKVTKMEWSSCQLDYVKEFMCNTKEDVAHLPACCVGSRAYVCENGKWYVCGADQTWKLEDEAMEEGTGEGGGTSGGASGGGGESQYIIVLNCDENGNTLLVKEESVVPSFSYLQECYNAKRIPNGVFYSNETEPAGLELANSLRRVTNFSGHDVNAMHFGSSGSVIYVTDENEVFSSYEMNEKYPYEGE